MEYDYIQRVYGASFYPGDTVEHTETNKRGTVVNPRSDYLHYVRADFGDHGVGLCHPRSLKIIARGPEWDVAQRWTDNDTREPRDV